MATNRVQFQPGLSLPAFLKQYGTESGVREGVVAGTLAERFRLFALHRHGLQPIPARRGMAVAVLRLPASNQSAIGHVV